MQHEDFSIALFGKQSLLCLPNKDKVTFLNIFIYNLINRFKSFLYKTGVLCEDMEKSIDVERRKEILFSIII